jgi:hypothetical protein
MGTTGEVGEASRRSSFVKSKVSEPTVVSVGP